MILALDLSLTATGWCRYGGDFTTAACGTIKTKIAKDATIAQRVARLGSVAATVCSIARGAEIVAIEEYAYCAGKGSANVSGVLGELHGVVMHQLTHWPERPDALKMPSKQPSIVRIPSNAGRAALGLVSTGLTSKRRKQTFLDAVRYLGATVDDDNQADALILANQVWPTRKTLVADLPNGWAMQSVDAVESGYSARAKRKVRGRLQWIHTLVETHIGTAIDTLKQLAEDNK